MKREVYLRAPQQGLPEVPGMRRLMPGEIVKCLRSVYGFKDAPLEWHSEHRKGILDCGAVASSLCHTLYLYYEKQKLKGSLGTHVDDDLMHFNPKSSEKYISALQKRFPYEK